jgi:hypothetical protein
MFFSLNFLNLMAVRPGPSQGSVPDRPNRTLTNIKSFGALKLLIAHEFLHQQEHLYLLLPF